MTTGRLLNHWGWLLAVATILTTLSLVPAFIENPSFEWVRWLGTPGTLLAFMILRPTDPAGFIVAGVIGFLANMFLLAVVCEGLYRGIRRLRGRPAPAAFYEAPAVKPSDRS
jgi:hypothetical protein